jgi:phosphatidate cytidylyltransferase
VATAAVLLAGLLAAMFLLPKIVFAVLIALVVALAAFEWARLCGLQRGGGLVYAVFAGIGMLSLLFHEGNRAVLAAATVFWILVVPAWLWRGARAGDKGALAVAGFAVLLPAGVAMALLEPLAVLLVLALVWIADTAAYFVGRAWGRRKLAPSISPGKTWEGAAGGLGGALAYAIICGTLIEGTNWVPYLAAAALIAALSVVGDLFESALKRQAGAKDSGTLLPGHGGILDRIDSITAALPVAALLVPLIRNP